MEINSQTRTHRANFSAHTRAEKINPFPADNSSQTARINERNEHIDGHSHHSPSQFQRELEERLKSGGDGTSPSAADITRLHRDAQKQVGDFQDLLQGVRHDAGGCSRPGDIQIVDDRKITNEKTAAPAEHVDSVFCQRNQIEDAAFQPQGRENPVSPGVSQTAQEPPTDTTFMSTDASYEFLHGHLTAPVSAASGPPETRASLLTVVQAQGPGHYLQLWA